MDPATLSRKKNVRRGHRASTTRVIREAYENMQAEDGPNLTKLQQQKLTLGEKIEILERLDSEILELVDEDLLEEEIVHADVVKEELCLAIMDIEAVLCPTASNSSDITAHDDESIHSEDSSVSDTHVETPVIPSPTHYSARGEATTRDSSTSEDTGDTSAYHSSSGDSHTSEYSHDSYADSAEGVHTRTRSVHFSANPEVHLLPEPESTPSHYDVPMTMLQPMTPTRPVVRVKLPKLSIKRFNGDLTRWVTFWDSFESAIHSNPELSDVDKFNYLHSYLESTAAEAIAGLTLTAANYTEAVSTLKKRFGNTQLIVNRHMDSLLALPAVNSQHDIKGLRRLYDSTEAHIRGLKALGVSAGTYGGLLTSILMNKLPQEIRLIISRELPEGKWETEAIMKILDREVDVRERSSNSTPTPRRINPKPVHSGAALLTTNRHVRCVFCEQEHLSSSCTVITDIGARRDVLRKSGRCFVCLRKNHISKNCRSSVKCNRCQGRHHVTVCSRPPNDSTGSSVASGGGASSSSSSLPCLTPPSSTPPTRPVTPSTNTMYVGSHTPILLQTAKLKLHGVQGAGSLSACVEVRAILDSGSQRSYVTSRVRDQLALPRKRMESLHINAFGSSDGKTAVYDAVNLNFSTVDGERISFTALVVPFICNPLASQPINYSKEIYDHLHGLELADSAEVGDSLDVDVLIGADIYWTLVTGEIRQGATGPTAISTKVGWILSGPVDKQETTVNLTLSSTHVLKVDCYPVEHRMDDQLKRFWELEALGIMSNEPSVYEKFTQQISFDGKRYQVCLPWRECHEPLPSNLELCRKRLFSLLKRLQQDPELLTQYNGVIQDQIRRGVVEIVPDPLSPSGEGPIHYLPHHGVVRQDRTTSKLRIVYDASAKSNGPSLNECLHTGPNFGQSIFEILLRFRLHKIVLAGDIEKAFLMVAVNDKDRDSLRFLWFRDVNIEKPELFVLRFTRVVFGVNASPFLLNATISHHMKKFQEIDPLFVKKFLSSIYVDDVSLGSHDVDSTFELYLKSRMRLAEAGFRLRKFVTNSEELRERISNNEQLQEDCDSHTNVKEEDQSYAKGSLGKSGDEHSQHKILGVQWDFSEDNFVFDMEDVSRIMMSTEPTKRNVVSMTSRFFDPMGILSPVTVSFKMFFQRLCLAGVDWDEPLTENLFCEWNRLISSLQGSEPLVIPRCCFADLSEPLDSVGLVGFCDASKKAYAAVVYLKIEVQGRVITTFLAAKTRVSPLKETTIPRLELLSALLLSKLMHSVASALESELSLGEPVCYSDSKVALYWIQDSDRGWEQFVYNRASTIRATVPAHCWRHCPGKDNPADMPSRGMTMQELMKCHTWLHGPEWLQVSISPPVESPVDQGTLEECRREMRQRSKSHALIAVQEQKPSVGKIIDCQKFSTLSRLMHVTGFVLRFVRLLRHKTQGCVSESTSSDENHALHLWIKESQLSLPQHRKFTEWKRQFDLFMDEQGIWRCHGRLSNSELPASAQMPVLLNKNHMLTRLLVEEAHERVMHNGVKDTLAELRSRFWLIQGRQYVRKLIHKCVTCRKHEGQPFRGVQPPPLPEFRVRRSRPFQYVRVDFAGPLFVKNVSISCNQKTWLCLFTCCTTRAVHLELVPDLSAPTFLNCFKRFTARRGIPSKIVSDNAKTFKRASRMIQDVMDSPDTKKHFSDLHVEWTFNLERAPWWGGIFKRMIKSAKRCLKKAIGRFSLQYDELLTLITEVEAVLNSRPLTYISTEDLEEALTPSHLLLGYRVLSLPDPTILDDPDFNESPSGLNRRMKHLVKTFEKFWTRWKKEYLLELRELHRAGPGRDIRNKIQEGEIVTVYDESLPRGLWRLGRIEKILRSSDGSSRGACVKVSSKSGRAVVLRRPIQHLYPLEVYSQEQGSDSERAQDLPEVVNDHSSPESTTSKMPLRRSRRAAAIVARDRIAGMAD